MIRSPSTNEEAELRAMLEESLPSCRPDSAMSLARKARLRRIQSDETISRQGEEVPLILVVRGYCGLRRTTVDGHQVMVGIAKPGELFGMSSIASTLASLDMVALTETEVATWSGPEVRRLAAVDPGLALDVIDRFALFLNVLTEKLDGFLHQGARRRVIRVLARYRDLFFSEPPVLSRSHLPGLVGTSREMTGRVLRELENEGTVSRVGRTGLKLLRPDRLDADREG